MLEDTANFECDKKFLHLRMCKWSEEISACGPSEKSMQPVKGHTSLGRNTRSRTTDLKRGGIQWLAEGFDGACMEEPSAHR